MRRLPFGPAYGVDFIQSITLGLTAAAIANMTAATQQYGAAHRAFIIVPLACDFFIVIVNALAISAFVN